MLYMRKRRPRRWSDHLAPSDSCLNAFCKIAPCYRVFSWKRKKKKKKKISYFSKPFQARILRLYLLSWVGVWWIIKFSRNALQNKNKNIAQPLWPKSWDLRREHLLDYEHSLEAGKAFCIWYRTPQSYCRMGEFKIK